MVARMTRPMPTHWLYRGQTACGIAFRSQTHQRRTTDDATKVTCAKCIAIQFALVGQSDVRILPFELVSAVRIVANRLPTSGWAGDRVRKAFRKAVAK